MSSADQISSDRTRGINRLETGYVSEAELVNVWRVRPQLAVRVKLLVTSTIGLRTSTFHGDIVCLHVTDRSDTPRIHDAVSISK